MVWLESARGKAELLLVADASLQDVDWKIAAYVNHRASANSIRFHLSTSPLHSSLRIAIMALSLRRPQPICSACCRTFATTSPLRMQLKKIDRKDLPSEIPAYPYPAQWYKQADRGLYGGQRIQFGNNVGEDSGTKTRRSWAVNVFHKRLFSKALNRFIQVKVSSRTLRTIEKVGGLDEYLLGEKTARIKGLGVRGWELRWAIMHTPAILKRFARERKALGLPELEKSVEQLEAERLAAMDLHKAIGRKTPVDLDVVDVEPVGEGLQEVIDQEVDQAVEDIANNTEAIVHDISAAPAAVIAASLSPTPLQYPRVKVGRRRTYMYLTPLGWRAKAPRTEQSPMAKVKQARESATWSERKEAHKRKRVLAAWREQVKAKVGAARAILDAQKTSGESTLNPRTRRAVLHHVRVIMTSEAKRSRKLGASAKAKITPPERTAGLRESSEPVL